MTDQTVDEVATRSLNSGGSSFQLSQRFRQTVRDLHVSAAQACASTSCRDSPAPQAPGSASVMLITSFNTSRNLWPTIDQIAEEDCLSRPVGMLGL